MVGRLGWIWVEGDGRYVIKISTNWKGRSINGPPGSWAVVAWLFVMIGSVYC